MKQQIRQALARFDADQIIASDKTDITDVRPSMPPGTKVARVNSRVLEGYAKVRSPQHRIMQQSIGRDHLWIMVDEQVALASGRFPDSLSRKIARFHLIDNTRGEPPMWEPGDVSHLAIRMDEQGAIHGDVRLATGDGQRGFEGTIQGQVESADNQLVQFDLLAKGLYWGEGKFTRSAPAGKFPFAVAIRLAPGDSIADQVLPQAIKGWHRQYINP